MCKELYEMTPEELWALFPIILTQPDPNWKQYYAEMETKLSDALQGFGIVRISHIGSTAIDGICAKPIVDILAEAAIDEDLQAIVSAAEKIGWIRMSEQSDRISLNYGYTKYGFAEKVYHLHLRFAGDNDELYFRDYLNGHPLRAKEYENLKLSLWKRYEHDRDGYTTAKTDFISSVTQQAKAAYPGRYAYAGKAGESEKP